MAIPQNKTELLEAIDATYYKLQTELDTIPEKLTNAKTMDGHAKGTTMSVCNLLAYLVGWGNLVLKWHRIKTKGKEPSFPETGYQWNELGALAQKFYADYRDDDYATLRKKLDKVVHDILKLIKSHDNHSLYHKPWCGTYTMGRTIQLNTSSPYKNAHGRLRRWKKARGMS